MLKTLTRAWDEWRDSFDLVAPASTLLVATTIALVLGLATQLAFAQNAGQDFGDVWVSQEAPPGGTIRVAIEDERDATYTVYLPGLSSQRLRLTFDPRTGYHTGSLRVPNAAPPQGFCTVRVVNGAKLEVDHRVRLLDLAKAVTTD